MDLQAALSGAESSRQPADPNRMRPEDAAAHHWFRFVLAYPPHLVRDCLDRLDVKAGASVLDPFAGTGTTLVECKKLGIASVGIEPIGVSRFAARTKLDWTPDPQKLVAHAQQIADTAHETLAAVGISDTPTASNAAVTGLRVLEPAAAKLLVSNSISALPLHKTLVLLDVLRAGRDESLASHETLALARVLPTHVGNLRFGPEVGVGRIKPDTAVIEPWLAQVQLMAADLPQLQQIPPAAARVVAGDARDAAAVLDPTSVDAVICSPPYPNEKDYSRTVRLESVLLGYVNDRTELQKMKRTLLRSNTRGVYSGDSDDEWIADDPTVQHLADQIEARRIALHKNSGFERAYAKVTRLYFGGMARHFASLRSVLRPGARLVYVVGDQASYLQVLIPTGEVLSDIAERAGYRTEALDLFRTRPATATRQRLREELLVLRWPG